ncbi:hypothetical protein [Paludisphaera borealis]|uniref:Uncharacterized protein n=1 Tax=Paludisphaera borealis TaxID=1387353 RepID=A0A1U7CNH7_9BACT|nr:hypothetical protein [Paludisphaera borealis]APW60456.1 hypothetical protein BSF38_01926 [Paludisphaera borealis]
MGDEQRMTMTIEIGPADTPGELDPYIKGDAFAAMLKAAFQTLTADRLYPGSDSAFTGRFGDTEVLVNATKMGKGIAGPYPTTFKVRLEATLTRSTIAED